MGFLEQGIQSFRVILGKVHHFREPIDIKVSLLQEQHSQNNRVSIDKSHNELVFEIGIDDSKFQMNSMQHDSSVYEYNRERQRHQQGQEVVVPDRGLLYQINCNTEVQQELVQSLR